MIDRFGRRTIHSAHGNELVHACCLHLFNRSKVLAQRLPPLRSDADDMIQYGDEVAFAAQIAVIGDRKSVCFVSNALDEIERVAAAREFDRFRFAFHKNQLELLRESDHGNGAVPRRAADDLERGGELPLAAVDDDEVGQSSGFPSALRILKRR